MDKIIELLSNTEQTSLIIKNISSYIIYIYPGIVSIYLYNFFVARTTKNTQAFVIKSFAISYLYNLFLQTTFLKMCFIKEKPSENSVAYNIILIVVAFFTPYFCYKIKMSKMFTLICNFLGINTSVTDVPFELLGDVGEAYTCVKAYLQNEPYVYLGYLGEYEYEEGHDKYVILTGYKKYVIKNNHKEKLIAGYGAEDYYEKVYLRFDDIKRIEKIGEKRAKQEIYKEKNSDKNVFTNRQYSMVGIFIP